MQWLGVGSTHAQRVDASVVQPPARVVRVVLVWPWRRYVARLPGCLAARPLERLAVFEFAKRPFEAVLTSEATRPAAPRRQRCGFPTMLAADFAPVPALAVGTERNVGREKASAAPGAPRLKLSLERPEEVQDHSQEQGAGTDLLQWTRNLGVALAWRRNAMAWRWKYPRSARGFRNASAAGAG